MKKLSNTEITMWYVCVVVSLNAMSSNSMFFDFILNNDQKCEFLGRGTSMG